MNIIFTWVLMLTITTSLYWAFRLFWKYSRYSSTEKEFSWPEYEKLYQDCENIAKQRLLPYPAARREYWIPKIRNNELKKINTN